MRVRSYVAVGLAVVLAGGAVAFATWNRPRQATYTTATAVRGDVVQTLVASGPVTRPGATQLSFDSPGVVTSVPVRVGDAVAAGQVVATLDPAPLQVSLLQAQAQLAQAKATLDADETSLANGTPALALPTQAAAPASPAPPAVTPTAPGKPAYVVELEASMKALQARAAAQQAACAPVYAMAERLKELSDRLASASPAPPTPGASPQAEASASPSAPSLPPVPPNLPVDEARKLAEQVQACGTATLALTTAQQDAGRALAAASAGMQADTLAAQRQLAAAQAQLKASAEAAGRQAAAQAMAQAQAQLAAAAQRAVGSRVTDATVAADRARVLQARQAVERAERAVANATLTSPVAGILGALNFVPGESSAGRSATVSGPGLAEVSIEVPLTARGFVTPGMPARVGPVGSDASWTGRVDSISELPTSASGNPTYTAKVSVDDPAMALPSGAKALVSLPLRSVASAVVVPVSAVVKTADNAATVEVVPDAFAESSRRVLVTTGAVGGGRIEILAGLEPGELVVLADRRLPVPGGLQQYQPASASASPTGGR